jgi:hypothetical protein
MELKQSHAALKTEVDSLKMEITALKEQLEAVKSDQDLTKFSHTVETVAYLTPGSEGYDVVQTDLGKMTVHLADVEPMPTAVELPCASAILPVQLSTGAKAKLEWGSMDTSGSPNNDSAHSRDVSFSQSLRAGAWTSVPVVLEGVPPTALGFVRVKQVSHTGISLFR